MHYSGLLYPRIWTFDSYKCLLIELKRTVFFGFNPFLFDKSKSESPLLYFNKYVLSPHTPQHKYINRCRLLELELIWIPVFTHSFCFLYKTSYHRFSSAHNLSSRLQPFNARSQYLMNAAESMTTQLMNYFTVNLLYYETSHLLTFTYLTIITNSNKYWRYSLTLAWTTNMCDVIDMCFRN